MIPWEKQNSDMEPDQDIDSRLPSQGEAHVKEALELLSSRALRDEDPLTRRHAIYLLGLSRNRGCIPVFIAALRDPEKAVRNQATRALAAIGKPASPPLIVLLEDTDWKVRYRAAEALGIMKNRDATNPLIARLTDDKDHVRYMAVKALGEIGNKEAIIPLKAMLQDKNPYVQRVTVSVLQKLNNF
jgi:HEAT repeat protein